MASAPVRVGGPEYYGLRADSDIGGEVYERRLLERLPGHGVSVVVGLPADHRAAGLPSGVEVDLLAHRENLHWVRAPAVFVPYVTRLLRRRRVDVLRGHSVRYCGPSLLLARSALRSSVPVVLHHHHFFPRWRALEARILRRADAVITVSEHSRQELVEAGVAADRVHVVLDGVERPPVGRRDPGFWPGPGLRLLSLGRLEARKRPALAIETLAELRCRGVAASLVVAGDGPQRQELARLAAAAGIEDLVRFAGRVGEERKWQLYDSAEVLLFGSTLEGFGLVVAEAQSRGLPVVAAAGTATSEAMAAGRSGLLVSPDAPAFAAAVSELADAVRREAMARAAAEFAKRFDWDECAAGVAEVYRRLPSAPAIRAGVR